MRTPFLAVAISIFLSGCSRSVPADHPRPVTAFNPLPGMPPVLNRTDIYSADNPHDLSPVVRSDPARIYVPDTGSNDVYELDPRTYRIVGHFKVGRQPQHIVPSWDLKSLWVTNDLNDTLTRIDPATGKKGETIHVEDPYNMYYTPDGKYAIVVAERKQRLDFHDAQSMELKHSLPVDCRGIDHLDFSADGRYFLGSCEFSGKVIKVDVAGQKVLGYLDLSPEAMPQDIKVSPDGKVFYIADMAAGGLWMVDGDSLHKLGFITTGKGVHGLYPSRDAKYLYASNRGEGSISVIDFATRREVSKWVLPGGGSPDMGGVSADGKVLWLSGRYNREVYAIDTGDGHLLARIKVGKGPHGLCVWPQPGRYSLGHTGILR